MVVGAERHPLRGNAATRITVTVDGFIATNFMRPLEGALSILG